MKNNLIVFFIISIIFVCFESCEKIDVPKGTPWCIKKMIKKQKDKGLAYVYSYQYKGETVYLFGNASNFVFGDCLSIKRELYTEDCSFICEPPCHLGGGDGGCPDFPQERTEEKEIWMYK